MLWDVKMRRVRVYDYTLNGVEAATQAEAEKKALACYVSESEWQAGEDERLTAFGAHATRALDKDGNSLNGDTGRTP